MSTCRASEVPKACNAVAASPPAANERRARTPPPTPAAGGRRSACAGDRAAASPGGRAARGAVSGDAAGGLSSAPAVRHGPRHDGRSRTGRAARQTEARGRTPARGSGAESARCRSRHGGTRHRRCRGRSSGRRRWPCGRRHRRRNGRRRGRPRHRRRRGHTRAADCRRYRPGGLSARPVEGGNRRQRHHPARCRGRWARQRLHRRPPRPIGHARRHHLPACNRAVPLCPGPRWAGARRRRCGRMATAMVARTLVPATRLAATPQRG